jgi:hypothetical protein
MSAEAKNIRLDGPVLAVLQEVATRQHILLHCFPNFIRAEKHTCCTPYENTNPEEPVRLLEAADASVRCVEARYFYLTGNAYPPASFFM